MATFGIKPKKPGSVPGSQSGDKERRGAAKVRGTVARAMRAEASGRAVRNVRSAR